MHFLNETRIEKEIVSFRVSSSLKSISSKKAQYDPLKEPKSNNLFNILVVALIFVSTIVVMVFVTSGNNGHFAEIDDQTNTICTMANQNERDWCYLDKTKKERLNYCNNIGQTDLKIYCLAFAKNKDSLCEEINNILIKDACYISLAIENNDETLCVKTSKTVFCEKKVNEENSET